MPKFLYPPVWPFNINQRFGENKACIPIIGYTSGTLITCDGHNPPQGYRSLYGPLGHLGLDLRASHSQPVYCAAGGIVYKIDSSERSGLDVRIETLVNGVKYRHIYEHLLGYQHKVGNRVELGTLVGWADNTGYSSGNHLHFQLEEWQNDKWVPVDPLLFMYTHIPAIQAATIIRRIKETLARLADILADLLRKAKNR